MPPLLTVHCDARVVAGRARFGWVLAISRKPLVRGSFAPPGAGWLTTQAEMYAVIAGALATAEELRARPLWILGVEFLTDSQPVVDHILGKAPMRDPEMAEALVKLRGICAKLPAPRFAWVPREQNWEADRLTRSALEKPAERSPTVNRRHVGQLSPARCGWTTDRSRGLATIGEMAAGKLRVPAPE